MPQPLILFGPLPPPTNGHTLAFRMLVDGCASRVIPCEVVNYSQTGFPSNSPWRTVFRVVDYFSIMLRYLKVLRKRAGGVVYITLNQSISGVIRDVLLILLAKRCGHRVVVHIHGGFYDQILFKLPNAIRKMAVNALSRSDAIILLSDRLRGMFREFPRLHDLIKVVTNGLPMNPPEDISPKNIDGNKPIKILFLSHFIESKGWWEILEAIEILVNDHELSIEATFCGEFIHSSDDRRFSSPDEAKQAFENFRKRLVPKAKIVWHSIIRGEEKERVLREAHFLILPSRYPNEGQPLVLIEGLAFGCVLIGTDYRALGDMIRPAKTGFLISPDCCSIARSIVGMVEDPHEYQKLSAGSLELFNNEFTTERHLERLLAVISGAKSDG
ncbi:MAG: glycosyltransferase family 4 protein [Candidatus Riflebacteria bacterium]|nr:glycosyltransferase family 4 protein [Candidatus Riflebacteria bacterium]